MRPVNGACYGSVEALYYRLCTYTKLVTIFVFQARLKGLQVGGIPRLLVLPFEMFRVVVADDVIAEVGRHNPCGLLAVHNSIGASILILTCALLVDYFGKYG
jgi:hypothetical protein